MSRHDVDSDAGFCRYKFTAILIAIVHQHSVHFGSCLGYVLVLVFVFFYVEVSKMDLAMVFKLLIILKIFVTFSAAEASNHGLIIIMIAFDVG